MFTGLIEATGRVERIDTLVHHSAQREGGSRVLRVRTPLGGELAPGDSIAVSGVCLTVSSSDSSGFEAIVSPETGAAVGVTTFLNIDERNRRVEIGSTWMAYSAHGKRINPSAKLLLLTRAFEDLDCIAVEFRTHAANAQSRAAIAKLGATQDGILRKHQVWGDGFRDTVVFSILDTEWPAVRAGLEARIAG